MSRRPAISSRRAVIYTRASLDATGEGASVARQEEACRALATARGWDVVEVLSDNSISAYGGKRRPGWEAVLQRVESGAVDVVVVWHLDRATRSTADLETFIQLVERTGVGMATASGDIDLTTDAGRMVARILGAVARQEVERKAARQQLANEQRARSGAPSTGGARPFGYTRDHLHVIDAEAAAIRWGAEQVLAGASLRTVADEWSRRGLRSSRSTEHGAAWTVRGVRGVLTSPRYAGVRTYKGEALDVEAAWPAILEGETHRRLLRLLGDEARLMGAIKRGRTPSNLLTALADCGGCRRPVNASRSRGRDVYTCRTAGCPAPIRAPRDLADAYVAAEVIALVAHHAARRVVAANDERGAAALERAQAARRRLDEAAADYADGVLTREQLGVITRRTRAQLAEAEAELAAARPALAVPELDAARGNARAVAQAWAGLDLERQRAAVEALFVITLRRVGRGLPDWTADEGCAVEDRPAA